MKKTKKVHFIHANDTFYLWRFSSILTLIPQLKIPIPSLFSAVEKWESTSFQYIIGGKWYVFIYSLFCSKHMPVRLVIWKFNVFKARWFHHFSYLNFAKTLFCLSKSKVTPSTKKYGNSKNVAKMKPLGTPKSLSN